MAKIIAPCISSKYFTYDPKSHSFVTEISDLPHSFNPLSPIYDDACDAGFTLVGQKTGAKITFHFVKCDVQDGDVMGWNFEPISECVRKNPKIKDVTLLVIND